MKKTFAGLHRFFRFRQIYLLLLCGVLSSIFWQNCSQPASVAEIEYQHAPDDLAKATAGDNTEGVRSDPNLKLNLVYEFAREVLIVLDKEDVSTPWVPLENPQPYVLPAPDGPKTLYIKFRNFNKRESDWIEMHYVLDTTAPEVTFGSSPATLTPRSDAEFQLNVTDNVSGVAMVECRRDTIAFASCPEVVNLTDLADGPHTFDVRARDIAGNTSEVKSFAWRVDATAPDLVIGTQPPPATPLRNATFAFTATDEGSSLTGFTCQLDALPAQPCVSPQNYTDLAAGDHNFKVTVKDAAGNPITKTVGWKIDFTPPTLAFTTTPKALGNLRAVSFFFTNTDTGSGIARTLCQLDTATPANCTSPANLTGVTDGAHVFNVATFDKAGNTKTISFNFTVDATNPDINPILTPTNYINSRAAAFQFNPDDGTGSGIATFECRVDDNDLSNCGVNKTFFSLANGPHSFQFKVTDRAGNFVVRNYNTYVDPENPTEPVFSIKPDKPSGRSVRILYESTDADSGLDGYYCSLDGETPVSCGREKNYSGLDPGSSHNFKVYSMDKAGNKSTNAGFNWSVAP